MSALSTNPALLAALQQRIGQLEGNINGQDEVYSTGCVALDRRLPAGGLRSASLVQWLARTSAADLLSLVSARQAMACGGELVVIDRRGTFFPPAAAALGIDLRQMIVLQPKDHRDELWAWDQTLRSDSVAAVWGRLGQLDGHTMRRLQLAARQGETLGLMLCPTRIRGLPTWAEVQLQVEPLARTNNRCWRVEVVRSRGRFTGGQCVLQYNPRTGTFDEASHHEKNSLRVVSAVAGSASQTGTA